MTDNDARAALAARQEDFDRTPAPLPSVAWGQCGAPLPSIGFRTVAEVWADELRASTARGSGGR